jgi:hypothetical protein
MRVGRLMPAGGLASPLSLREIVKAAQAKASRDVSQQLVEDFAKSAASITTTITSSRPELARSQAEEAANERSVPSVLAPSDELSEPVRPQKGLGREFPAGMDKEAIAGFLRLGKALAGSKRGVLSRLGQRLQQPLRQAKGGVGGMTAGTVKKAPNLGKGTAAAPPGAGTPYRGAGTQAAAPTGPQLKPAPNLAKTAPSGQPTATGFKAMPPKGEAGMSGMAQQKPLVKSPGTLRKDTESVPGALVKKKTQAANPKSLTGMLAGPALLGAGIYGLSKGIPGAVDFATQAAKNPMPYGGGLRQYQYGYTPDGQAQF